MNFFKIIHSNPSKNEVLITLKRKRGKRKGRWNCKQLRSMNIPSWGGGGLKPAEESLIWAKTKSYKKFVNFKNWGHNKKQSL